MDSFRVRGAKIFSVPEALQNVLDQSWHERCLDMGHVHAISGGAGPSPSPRK